ncbi:hypothetical protein COCC4DRAFT_32887 [Bipolaris maydis ATCC 48331]|uniref:Uncharacterized protein n=2 Tax=Cochliobolus heterostrophus TaxID=5016 RepID=M2VA30_COCH5|nr:uncharacterized protein COCC4DRAFT_32887 [Bipolaris maydis ATCC 48331]EMD96812.1 hypothetical protein COCHEDRAFT_1018573 [Bipolaris maydis C5]ENI03679.1 hypothetical protein COCC4DRAFT_32887 [Bipolaris maydis ATCC 48331]
MKDPLARITACSHITCGWRTPAPSANIPVPLQTHEQDPCLLLKRWSRLLECAFSS